MAIFAPTFNVLNFDDVFVYNFHTYNNQLQSLVPLGMTFGNLLGVTIGYPHPVILRMSKAEFKIVKENYELGIVDQLWNNIKKENPIIDEETGKTVWDYSIRNEGLIGIPLEYTTPYDLTGEGLGSIKDFIKLKIFGPIMVGIGGFEFGRIGDSKYLLKFTLANIVNFDPNNLLLTCCRYKNDNILNFGGNIEDVGTFFDCGPILPFEEVYLLPPVLLGGPLITSRTFPRIRVVINNKEINREPMPNCNKCFILGR